jgi:hypothetical protein
MNLGGAKDRPDLQQVWENVQAKIEGVEKPHKQFKLWGAFSVLGKKLGLFS